MPSGGTPRMPSSRWRIVSDQPRSSSRSDSGTPSISLTTSIGIRPAKSATKSMRPASRTRSR